MISLQKKFLFIHTPKTAGNSIASALLRWSEEELHIERWYQDGVDRFSLFNPRYATHKHSVLAEYQASLPGDLYASLFKFAVLRNPWDRMISFYFSPNRVITGDITGWNREEFLEVLGRPEVQPLRHFISLPSHHPQAKLDSALDFLLRFENLEADFAQLCDRLSIPRVSLPMHNFSERRHYSHYYDAELRELVARRFAEEIAFGGYEFGE